MGDDLPRRQFAEPGVTVASWYVACAARRLGRRAPKGVHIGQHRVALWRDSAGIARALLARCPHLGADLSQGRVTGDCLRCPLHGWTFGADGRTCGPCGAPPDRRARALACVERYGLVWVHPDPHASPELLDLPDGSDRSAYRLLRTPAQRIRCHPHLVIGNGLDVRHMDALHDLAVEGTPVLDEPGPQRLRLQLAGRPRSRVLRGVIGVGPDGVRASFETREASLAWMTATVVGGSSLRFHVLFTGRPDPTFRCETQSVWFLPRTFGLAPLRAIAFVYALLHDDRRTLEGMRFHRGFTEEDRPLARFAELVDVLPAWI